MSTTKNEYQALMIEHKRRQERNGRLLARLENIEKKAAFLQAKTDRIKSLKSIYRNQVEKKPVKNINVFSNVHNRVIADRVPIYLGPNNYDFSYYDPLQYSNYRYERIYNEPNPLYTLKPITLEDAIQEISKRYVLIPKGTGEPKKQTGKEQDKAKVDLNKKHDVTFGDVTTKDNSDDNYEDYSNTDEDNEYVDKIDENVAKHEILNKKLNNILRTDNNADKKAAAVDKEKSSNLDDREEVREEKRDEEKLVHEGEQDKFENKDLAKRIDEESELDGRDNERVVQHGGEIQNQVVNYDPAYQEYDPQSYQQTQQEYVEYQNTDDVGQEYVDTTGQEYLNDPNYTEHYEMNVGHSEHDGQENVEHMGVRGVGQDYIQNFENVTEQKHVEQKYLDETRQGHEILPQNPEDYPRHEEQEYVEQNENYYLEKIDQEYQDGGVEYVAQTDQQYTKQQNQEFTLQNEPELPEQSRQEYVEQSGQEYIEPSGQEYIEQSGQEYVEQSGQEYVEQSGQEYVEPSEQIYTEQGQGYIEPTGEVYAEQNEQQYVDQSGQEYVDQSGQEYVDQSGQEYIEHDGQQYVEQVGQEYKEESGHEYAEQNVQEYVEQNQQEHPEQEYVQYAEQPGQEYPGYTDGQEYATNEIYDQSNIQPTEGNDQYYDQNQYNAGDGTTEQYYQQNQEGYYNPDTSGQVYEEGAVDPNYGQQQGTVADYDNSYSNQEEQNYYQQEGQITDANAVNPSEVKPLKILESDTDHDVSNLDESNKQESDFDFSVTQ